MIRALLVGAVAAVLSGCGVYVARGGGSYSFVGLGSDGVARRCSPFYAAQEDAEKAEAARLRAWDDFGRKASR